VKLITLKKVLLPIITLFVCASIFVSCSKTESTTPTPPTASVSKAAAATPTLVPKSGGTLIMRGSGAVVNMGHPGYRSASGDSVYRAPGIEYMLDTAFGEYIPVLAESWEISPDGTAIILHLRKGIKFHDGTDFNAQAAKYLMDVSRQGELDTWRSVTSVDVIDDYTVKYNIKAFEWGMIASLCATGPSSIVSPTSLQSRPKEDSFLRPVGTGPFKFTELKQSVSVKYERFANYWQKGLPYLDNVEIKIIDDLTTAKMALRTGEINYMSSISPADLEDLKKAGFNIVSAIGNTVCFLPDSANKDSPFSNVKVRQALSYAVDRESLAKSLGHGYYEATYQPFGKWSKIAYNPDIAGQTYNTVKAKQLLAEAGYSNGFSTRLITTEKDDLNIALQDMLREVGIKLDIEIVTSPKMVEYGAKGWTGLLRGDILNNNGHEDPYRGLDRAYLATANYVSVAHPPEMMALFKKTNTEQDVAKRKDLFKQLTKQIVDDNCTALHLYVTTIFTALDPSVQDSGVGLTQNQGRGWVYKTWLSK
jgi:peptide/nickel transport system substrate-binding protein